MESFVCLTVNLKKCMYSTKLFDLLTPGEVSVVKSQTDIRNVMVNDLTVGEVFDLSKCLLGTDPGGAPMPASVLVELWKRHTKEKLKQVSAPSEKKWYCDQQQFGGGERCLMQCDSCEGLRWPPEGPS